MPTNATAGNTCSSRALLTPEELIQAALRKQQQKLRNGILSIMVDVVSKSVSSNGEIIKRSASVNPAKTHHETTANNVDSSNSSSAVIPGPPRLQRNTLHVQPGAYRIYRGQSMVVSASNNHKRTTPEMDDDNGCRESRRDPADTIIVTATTTSSRNGPNDCSFTSTSSSTSTIRYTHQEEEEEDENDRDRSTLGVVPLEAELVEVVDQQVVKAEPMPNHEPHNNRRGASLIFFICFFLILTTPISLLLYFLQQPKNTVLPDFPYYTHHTVLFVSVDAALKEFEIVLTCGNGAVATKNVQGPCDERDGDSILCRLGHILGNYNRAIFFSCGSNTIVEEPSVTISAAADNGSGLLYLSLFQVCHDVPIEQNSTCGDNAQWIELKEGNNDTFVLCASFNNSSTILSVTNVGVTCPADQPFDPSPAQFRFSQHRQNAILSWSKPNTTTAPTVTTTPNTTPTAPS